MTTTTPSPETRPRTLRDLEYVTFIRDMAPSDRPRERLRDAGAGALSNPELLAILLRTGTANESVIDLATGLLTSCGGLEGLARRSHAELCTLKGFGEAKAAQLLAALELGRRVSVNRGDDRPVVRSPQDVERLLRDKMVHYDQEHFVVLVLDTRNRLLAEKDLFTGTVNATNVRTAEVFREAVVRNAPGIIIAHNHPAGDPQPSAEDLAVTREIARAGKMLDIDVLDHIVIARQGVASLREMRAFT